ncbi:terminase large subunit domain-containing protein [Streptomyces lasalocidi]|uniref:Terminase n=1 Tax=Streptomyces lasalocidi TaxID=324833 RepID=A0A4U5WRS9_STRLS|nr:terminase family protein [Streptomyces lasalocidi]TKT03436.1 hypothetical protein E4U91_27315 [Streptomyces lasalocidi]
MTTLLDEKLNDVPSVGSQTPRLSLIPESFYGDTWETAVELAAKYKLDLDEWQQNVLKGWMGERENETWTCALCGLSVPRQNGKGGVLEARELYGLVMRRERILHTAHELKTAKDHFRRMKFYFENDEFPDLKKMVKRISNVNGEEAIWLENGGVIRFVARSKGSGRGFTADLLVCDEAQEMDDDRYEALQYTLATSKNPQTILTGTPPAPNMNGEVFQRFRDSALRDKVDRLCWLEWSAERSDDLDSFSTWAKANPALGYRLDLEKTQNERSGSSDEGFARERLGMWQSLTAKSVFDMEAWEKLIYRVDPDGPYAFAVDVSPMRDRASIAMATYLDGKIQVQIVANDAGTAWLPDALYELQRKYHPVALAIDVNSPAGSLIPQLKAKRVRMLLTGEKEVRHGSGAFFDGVNNGTILHVGQDALTTAVANAKKRAIGDAFGWDKKNASVDLTPLVAATAAAHALTLRRPLREKREEAEEKPKRRQRLVAIQ